MKTVAELAKELNVTPQAIYKKINKPQFKQFIKKDKRHNIVISIEGVELIKRSFNDLNETVETVETVEKNGLNNKVETLLYEQIEQLKRTVESVESQLKIKDSQIKEISDQNKELIKQNENSQSIIYSMQQQQQLQLESQQQKERKGLFGLFKRKEE